MLMDWFDVRIEPFYILIRRVEGPILGTDDSLNQKRRFRSFRVASEDVTMMSWLPTSRTMKERSLFHSKI